MGEVYMNWWSKSTKGLNIVPHSLFKILKIPLNQAPPRTLLGTITPIVRNNVTDDGNSIELKILFIKIAAWCGNFFK
jgi:hypothetical protein